MGEIGKEEVSFRKEAQQELVWEGRNLAECVLSRDREEDCDRDYV